MTRTPLGSWRFTAVLTVLALALTAGPALSQQYGERIVTGILVEPPPQHVGEETIRALITHEVGQPYDRKKAEGDLDSILYTLGRFDPDPNKSFIEERPGGTNNGILLVYHLTENPAVTGVTISGNTLVPTETLLAAVEQYIKNGDVFDSGAPVRDGVAQAIEGAYLERGYEALLWSGPTLDPATGAVSLAVLEEYVYDIEVNIQSPDGGKAKTKRKVAEREIMTKVGDPVSRDRVQKDLNRLYNLDIFEPPSVSAKDGPEPGDKILVFNLIEKKTGVFNLGVGYSDREGIIGFAEVQERNLMGMGRRLSGRAEFGSVHLYDVTYYEPWLGGNHASLEVSLYDRTSRQDRVPLGLSGAGSGQLSTEQRRGVSLMVSKPTNDSETNWIAGRYRLENVVNEDPRLVSVIAPSLRRGRVGSLMVRWSDDSRNVTFDPTEGSRLDVSFEHADRWLGSESVYSRIDIEGRKFWEVGDEGVLALRGVYGTILGNAPIFDTYAVGGAETLRGYREDRFFGTKRALMQIEFRKFLGGGDDKRDFQAVAFVDVGDAWGGQWRAADGTIYSAEHMSFTPQIGYGVGVRVSTALGPIRLDWGFGREGNRAHFGLYQTF